MRKLKTSWRVLSKMKMVIALAFAALTGCASGPGPAAADVSTDIDGDLAGLDELDTDLDLSELDSLENEFADLEAMFS